MRPDRKGHLVTAQTGCVFAHEINRPTVSEGRLQRQLEPSKLASQTAPFGHETFRYKVACPLSIFFTRSVTPTPSLPSTTTTTTTTTMLSATPSPSSSPGSSSYYTLEEDPFVQYARSLHDYTLKLWMTSRRQAEERAQARATKISQDLIDRKAVGHSRTGSSSGSSA